MAGTPLPTPGQYGIAGQGVVVVGVVAFGFAFTVQDGLPADQPPTVVRGSQREVAKHQKHAAKRPGSSAESLYR